MFGSLVATRIRGFSLLKVSTWQEFKVNKIKCPFFCRFSDTQTGAVSICFALEDDNKKSEWGGDTVGQRGTVPRISIMCKTVAD